MSASSRPFHVSSVAPPPGNSARMRAARPLGGAVARFSGSAGGAGGCSTVIGGTPGAAGGAAVAGGGPASGGAAGAPPAGGAFVPRPRVATYRPTATNASRTMMKTRISITAASASGAAGRRRLDHDHGLTGRRGRLRIVGRQSLRDDFGGPVLRHGHTVKHVGELHRALLVRHDDHLRLLRELLECLQEPHEVHVVE